MLRLRESGSMILFVVIGVMMLGIIFLDAHYKNAFEQGPEQTANHDKAADHADNREHGTEVEEEEGQGSEDHEETQRETGEERDPYLVTYHQIEGDKWIKASELADVVQGSMDWDEVNKTLSMELFQIPFHWIQGVSVVERNGLFLPYEMEAIFDEEQKEVYLPLSFLTYGLEVDTKLEEASRQAVFYVGEQVEEAFAQMGNKSFDLGALGSDDLIVYLSFLSNPIPDALISTRESHLPGAPRSYRNGYHEGIDWYSGASGREIDLNTPVLSVADGVVVRVDHDYIEMTSEERDHILSWSHQLRDTPDYILDKLRGRSVWVQYDHGVMVRYAHLSHTEEGLYVGQKISRGEVLGYVGNSGTSFAIDGDETGGLHLHADLLIYGELFWKYIDDPNEVRRVLKNTFQDTMD